jgi:hypothetical protein
MDLSSYHPTVLAISIVVATMLATSLIQWTFLVLLRRRHLNQWRHAGSPTIWSDQSFISAWPTIRYLQNQGYWSSGDNDGAQFCHRFRYPMVIGYWLTIFVFAGGVYVAFENGFPPSWG